jgi:carboxymethylenebutenolidase
MGESVEFASNGGTAGGYLARPGGGTGPGVIVLQEWWGLNPQIKGVCDRLAGEGFAALAPDLYHGELAGHDEMDKAGQLMNALPPDRAARDMGGAVGFLLDHDASTGSKVGVIGFCMGGMLTWLLAANGGDNVGAAVPFYGFPQGDMEPDWSGLTAPVVAHMAENDDFFPPSGAEALAEKLRGQGKDVTVHVYAGTGHAFANEENALGTYNEEAKTVAWSRTVEFLKSNLAS